MTEHRKRDHFGQKFKTELLYHHNSSYLGLRNDTSWEARSATTMKIQDANLRNLYVSVRTMRDVILIGERSEPLSRVFNDQPRDICDRIWEKVHYCA